MKRSILLGILAALSVGIVYLASCSQPLDVNKSTPNNNPGRVDTVYVFDTLTPSDSAVRIDTLTIHDTVYDSTQILDTLRLHDTVTVHDTIRRFDTLVRVDTAIVVETTTVFDTITLLDTIVRVDTVTRTEIHVDTLTLTDTVHVTDTVIVDPANCTIEPSCGRISCGQKEIVWIFHNDAGEYHLNFDGIASDDTPLQTMIVKISGTSYTWRAAQSSNWSVDLDLPANTIIKITLANPPAYGHEIDVCMTMTKK